MLRLLDANAAAEMLRWESSGFSVDASVQIALIDRDVPRYLQGLEHLLRYGARPPFAREAVLARVLAELANAAEQQPTAPARPGESTGR